MVQGATNRPTRQAHKTNVHALVPPAVHLLPVPPALRGHPARRPRTVKRPSAGDSVRFLRQVLERDVEKRHIRVLEIQLLLANRERPVADGKQLFLIEVQLPLVVHRPLEFACHTEGIHRTGIDAHPAK